MSEQWPDWAERSDVPARGERQSMQRLVRYEVRTAGGALDADPRREGTGLTVNVGDGGLCLLLDWAPTVSDTCASRSCRRQRRSSRLGRPKCGGSPRYLSLATRSTW
jgi:hypothetical protein